MKGQKTILEKEKKSAWKKFIDTYGEKSINLFFNGFYNGTFFSEKASPLTAETKSTFGDLKEQII